MFCCPSDSKIQWILQVILYIAIQVCICTQIPQLRFSQDLISPSNGREGWRYVFSEQIAKDCDNLRGYPPAASFESIYLDFSRVVMLIFVLSFAWGILFLAFGNRRISSYCSSRLYIQSFRRIIPAWLSSIQLFFWGDRATGRLNPRFIVALCASVIFRAGASFVITDFYMRLQASRDGMRKYVQDEYEDNDWGFGQVLAVAVWAAWLLDAVFLIVGEWFLVNSWIIYLTAIEDFLLERFVRPRQRRASHGIGPSTPRLDQQQPGQARSTTPEGQEQTTGVDRLVSE